MDITTELIGAVMGLITTTFGIVVNINYRVGKLEAKISMMCDRVKRLEEYIRNGNG